MVGNYESALDLTQEIFIKVYSSLRRYRPEFKFSTWIYKIAHNAAVDHLRRNTTREQSLDRGTGRRSIRFAARKRSPESGTGERTQRDGESKSNQWSERFREIIVS